MKRILVALLLTAAVLTAYAAKSSGTLCSFAQPDGTQISVRLLGDEYFMWYQTIDNILLIRQDNAFYIAKTDSCGHLLSSGIMAHNAGARSQQELEAAAAQDKAAYFGRSEEARRASAMRNTIEGYPQSYFCPHSGTVRVPVIIVEYPDMPLTLTDKTVWEEYFNGTTCTPYSKETRWQGYGSVGQYFRDASNGQLNMEFDLYGPYTVKNGHDAYGKAKCESSVLCQEAVELADADIDFAQYDSDNDGRVDMVYVLYAGTGANISCDLNDVCPSCWNTSGAITNADGKKINILGCASELTVTQKQNPELGDKRSGIGVTCHEMSHGMGMPDLYWTLATPPTDAEGYVDYNNCGPEDWDLMDGGENLFNAVWPCQYTAWERDVMGWIEAEELTEPTTVTLWPLNKEGGKAYRVTNPANKNEYYIIENYQRDEWNQYISNQYGTGLMITHLNAADNGFSMRPNNTLGKPNITILPADGYILGLYSAGRTINYRGSTVTMPTTNEVDENGKKTDNWRQKYYYPETQGDPFAGTKSKVPVTSLAAYKNYAGEEMVARYPITDIKHNGDGSMSFKFMGGSPAMGIADLADTEDAPAAIFSLDGVCVGTSVRALPKGIYIREGTKFIQL